MFKIIYQIASITLIFLIASCAKQYQASSNLDPNNFEEYFSVGKVKMYPSTNALPNNSKLVGLVMGEDCQAKPHLAKPDPIRARSDARRKAYDLHANAIVFSQCVTIEDEYCHSMILCQGQAYQTFNNETDTNTTNK